MIRPALPARPRRRLSPRRGACLTIAAVLAAVTVAAGPAALAAPTPPAPTDVGQAQTQAQRASAHVAQVSAGIRAASGRVAAVADAADLAEAHYEAQQAVTVKLARAASEAAFAAQAAQRAYQRDREAFVALIAADYESDGGYGVATSLGSLLLVKDPSGLLAAAQNQQFVTQHQAAVVDRAETSAEAYEVAEQRRVSTLHAAQRATAATRSARDAAARALRASAAQLAALRQQLADARSSEADAEQVLSQFLGGWALADPARAGELDATYRALAGKVATQRPAPWSDHWTAAIGRSVVRRALQEIDVPYAWDGGSASGPTRGVCAGDGAENDCRVTGFDCSGLALYAWAPYLGLPHSAAEQYVVAGRVHPRPGQLRPGDLVFWSGNATVAGIHHVALYVGDGNVLQAPNSGDIVRVTPLGNVDSGYFGATRPLT